MTILAVILLSLAGAILPTLGYVLVAVWFDRYEKEPWWLLALTFFGGAVPAVVLSLIVELVIGTNVHQLLNAEQAMVVDVAIVAPIVEEIFKALPVLLVYLVFRREFDGLMDGLLYGALAGFGFAMTENAFYFLPAFGEGLGPGLVLVFLRAIVFGVNHALYTSMFGLGLGIARYALRPSVRWLAPGAGLLAGMALHMIHNFTTSSGTILCVVSLFSNGGAAVIWLLLVIYALRQEQQWIRQELAEEVQEGRLHLAELEAAASYQKRIALHYAALRAGRSDHARFLWHLTALAADLAFKKRQLRIHGDEQGNVAEVSRLRSQIWQTRAMLAM
jgi:RsiW-degrading membrane proteinase PrsW (M82 family)